MKIIHDPETCPLCEYSREGLEPGRPCPECGVGLFPDAPTFDFLPTKLRWITLLVSVMILGQTLLFVLLRMPGWRILVPLALVAAVAHFWMSWSLRAVRIRAMFSLGEILFVWKERVLWRLPYDDIANCRGRWPLGGVVLRQKRGRRRTLPAWRRKDQTAVVSAIDDVLARYRMENAVPNRPSRKL